MKILKHQHWHFILLAAMLFVVFFVVKSDSSFFSGELFGISTFTWFIFALLSPIVHQIYVLICWRAELYGKSISKSLGVEKGFKVFKLAFTFLILSRPVTILLLSISNAWTMDINNSLSYIVSLSLFIPAAYLFYSVKNYFGADRAFGADHFFPEKYKDAPMIKKGIFKYTSNGMYIYGFFLLWIPGVLLQSKAALLLAAFNHIYIWVHYYFTELPDMKVIYNNE